MIYYAVKRKDYLLSLTLFFLSMINFALVTEQIPEALLWRAILDGQVRKEGARWSLPNEIEWLGNIKHMYVRDSYVELADYLLTDGTDRKLGLLLGPKGIGKSTFINYLLVRIVEKARSENALQNLSIIYYFQRLAQSQPEEIRFTITGASYNSQRIQAKYFIADSLDIGTASVGEKLVLLVSSENKANYNKFRDRLEENRGDIFRMKEWTKEEFLVVKDPDCAIEELNFIHDVFGGRIRALRAARKQSATVDDDIDKLAVWMFGEELKQRFPLAWNGSMRLIRKAMKEAVGKSSETQLAFQTSLFVIIDDGEGKTRFSSTFLKLVAGTFKDQMDADLWGAITNLFGASGRGICFEAIGHKALIGVDVQRFAKKFSPGRKTIDLKFFGLRIVLIRSVEDIAELDNGVYALPIFENFMLVDAIVKPGIMLQFTISNCHGKETDITKWEMIRNELGGNRKDHKLIFVIPVENVDKKFQCIGVPADLDCYWMTYEELASRSVLQKIPKKRRLNQYS